MGFYFEEGFEVYLRFNTSYDIVRGCKYEKTESGEDLYNAENEVEPCVEFLSFVKLFLEKHFYKTYKRVYSGSHFVPNLGTEVDVWRHSCLIGARQFLSVSMEGQNTFFT